MILDGICYPVIHFGRVILYVWSSPPVVSIFLANTLLYVRVFSSQGIYRRTCVSPDAPLTNSTSFISYLQDSQPFPLAKVY